MPASYDRLRYSFSVCYASAPESDVVSESFFYYILQYLKLDFSHELQLDELHIQITKHEE